jgi:hypothetical protein
MLRSGPPSEHPKLLGTVAAYLIPTRSQSPGQTRLLSIEIVLFLRENFVDRSGVRERNKTEPPESGVLQ